jgi:hypothetical protein
MHVINSVRTFIKDAPVIGPLLGHLRGDTFKNSADYWDRRYRKGGNSGAGSYSRLAEFKADFLNTFVAQNYIPSVIEFGSGDGAQLKLARYPSYTGVDVSAKAVEMCRATFANDSSKRFFQLDEAPRGIMADLSLSLDVIYHLVEDAVFHVYMQQLFDSARSFVVVYSSNMDREWPENHVRHRQFTRWVAENKQDWCLQSIFKNAYPYDPADSHRTSFADFYVFARRS